MIESKESSPTSTPLTTIDRPKSQPDTLEASLRIIEAKAGRFSTARRAQLDDVARREADKDRAIRRRRLKAECNVWEKYRAADLDDIEWVRANAPDCLTAYSEACVRLRALLRFPGCVVLRGENGPGKTHLASALVNAFIHDERSAYYCTALDFYRQLKSTFGAPGKTAEDLVRRFRQYELLVIDELEVRSDKEWENVELRSLIDARYASMKSTVLITNKTREQLGEYLSPAIQDRICESGGVINCDWRSLRRGV